MTAEFSLADHVHAWTYSLPPMVKAGPFILAREWEASQIDLRMAMRKAHRFVLDDAFTREVVRRAATQPTKMLSYCDLANLPYDVCFIEFSCNVRVDAQREIGSMSDGPSPERTIPSRAGFLLERRHGVPSMFRATYCMSGGPNDDPNLMPVGGTCYVVDLLGGAASETFVSSDPDVDITMKGMGWGYGKAGAAPNLEDQADVYRKVLFDTEAGRTLTHRGVPVPEPRFGNPLALISHGEDAKRGLVEMFLESTYEGRGDLRFIITMLAMINTVPITYVHRAAKGFQRRRLRNVPYLDATTLTIHCGKRKIVTVVDEAFREATSRHKRHEVRGFWRNAEYGVGTRGCQHEPVERDESYALCGKCHRLIVWVDHHERGDATLGYVKHDYLVKP